MRALPLLVLACLLVTAAIVGTRDPDEPVAVAALLVALGMATAALAAMFLARSRRRAGRRVAGMGRPLALRRGAEIGAVVALLLWLRVVDGLSVITGSFVVAAFAIAEWILSARPVSSR